MTIKNKSLLNTLCLKELVELRVYDTSKYTFQTCYDIFYDDEDDDDEYYDLDDLIQVAEALLQDTSSGIDEFSNVLDNSTLQEIKSAKEALAEALDEEDMNLIETNLNSLLTLWDSIESDLEEE